MHEQVDFVATAIACQADGFDEVVVGGQRDGIALVVEIAEREANFPIRPFSTVGSPPT